MKVMPSPQQPSAREVLIESLGSLSEEEERKLHGPGWNRFAGRKVRSLREARKWVYALATTMGLLAVALPTTAFYHYYEATETFSILGFLGLIAAACTFAAVQMGWAVYVYMNWRRQLRCYEGLRALGREEATDAGEETPAAQRAG
jgi:antibiotic biosynthesis monooxygenase (ABM) superfamily enzyme